MSTVVRQSSVRSNVQRRCVDLFKTVDGELNKREARLAAGYLVLSAKSFTTNERQLFKFHEAN